jgi:hypothetical protein
MTAWIFTPVPHTHFNNMMFRRWNKVDIGAVEKLIYIGRVWKQNSCRLGINCGFATLNGATMIRISL